MYAIIRLGKGVSYHSLVFGVFCPITATDRYQRYLQSVHNLYFVVRNKDKTELIKQYVFDKDKNILIRP